MTYLALITIIHTLLSIAAIPIGVLAMVALFRPNATDGSIRLFLWLAGLTSVTGFLFPFKGMTPAIGTGIIAVLVLGLAMFASRRLERNRIWRATHALALVASLYLLIFVAVVQAFLKIGFLHNLAPTGTELPFVFAQFYALAFFAFLGFMAVRSTRPKSAPGRRAGELG